MNDIVIKCVLKHPDGEREKTFEAEGPEALAALERKLISGFTVASWSSGTKGFALTDINPGLGELPPLP